jgi:uncharacterized protein (DUF362 family)/Pyruvate/2-oxoacid:ferredoxin oxidoreductase delta subunit
MKVLVRPATYDEPHLQAVFNEMMDRLGGREAIQAGMRVILKPNLLSPAKPRHAVLTHPLVVRAAVQYVLERGARPEIMDSPAMGSFNRILRENELDRAIDGLPVAVREFRESVPTDVGPPFGKIEMAGELRGADVIVNLPKLKTHGQMAMTLGVKNLFGCVVGYRKAEWHLRAGVDRDQFARLLVRIARAVRPAFTVLDGILAMEGEGPGKGGTPRALGVLMAARDPFALDEAVCRMVGLPPERLPTCRAARELGLPGEEIEIDGELPEVRGYRIPGLDPLLFGSAPVNSLARRHLLQRPVCDPAACTLCGVCRDMCPARAITVEEKGLRFDYDACIRCYCCLEVCPSAAIRTAEPLTGRLLRPIVKRLF